MQGISAGTLRLIRRDRRLVERTREAASAASAALGAAVHLFDRRCSELTHRTKGGAECTNICS